MIKLNMHQLFIFSHKKYLLGFIVFFTLLPKLIICIINYENPFLVNTVFNIEAPGYFPIIISFSDFIFNPSYLDDFKDTKLIPFPIYGFFFHSFFYKVFGIYSFFILELIFQFVFLIIFVKVTEKIFQDKKFSLFFCILIFLTISLLKTILIYEDNFYIKHLYYLLEEDLGARFPRPLFTGIIYFYFFYLIFKFRKNFYSINIKYFTILFLLLAIFLNSFFYYFINFSLLLLFLFLKYSNKKFFESFFKSKKKIVLILLSFLIFCLPFIIQLYFGEEDYSKRLGVIELNNHQKLNLLKYYLVNLFRIEFLFIIIPTLAIHIYLNKNLMYTKKQITNLNIFFYFIISSIVSPPIFFILSPQIVSIYHFLDILQFIIFLYLIFSFGLIINKLFKIKQKFKNYNFINFILLLMILILNFYADKNLINKNNESINDFLKVNSFLEKNNISKSNKKLFTNDKDIMLLWLLNGNKQLTISWGFVNSLKNKDIEDILISNLKSFGVTRSEFKTMISYGTSKIREKWHYLIYNYMFQANSLYTHSQINNYSEDIKKKIMQTSPFRAQSLIVPEDVKEKLLDKFDKNYINNNFTSELIIINKSINKPFSTINISSKNYELKYTTNSFVIYSRK